MDLAALGPEDLRRVAQQLQASLQARELQLERKGQEIADMQHVQDQVMVSLKVCLRCGCPNCPQGCKAVPLVMRASQVGHVG